ncbi:MAG TPA: (d)CMP kinase [Firmicutes bacterium]|nr:(d)CMP kinase [Bacillota bacterium]
MRRAYRSIAIDGPSGAGKSSLSGQLARAIGYLHVDTGAIYRTVGLAASRRAIGKEDAQAVTAMLPELDIQVCYGPDGGQRMVLDGEDVTEAIRSHAVSQWASIVAAIPAVRAFLLDTQRRLAQSNNVIMDGRDIGTVVLPDADLKIFLTARPEDRARRRYLELCQRGEQADEEQILQDVLGRDRQDMERAVSPLRPAPDAVVADTTGKGREESFQLLMELVQAHLGEAGGMGR